MFKMMNMMKIMNTYRRLLGMPARCCSRNLPFSATKRARGKLARKWLPSPAVVCCLLFCFEYCRASGRPKFISRGGTRDLKEALENSTKFPSMNVTSSDSHASKQKILNFGMQDPEFPDIPEHRTITSSLENSKPDLGPSKIPPANFESWEAHVKNRYQSLDGSRTWKTDYRSSITARAPRRSKLKRRPTSAPSKPITPAYKSYTDNGCDTHGDYNRIMYPLSRGDYQLRKYSKRRQATSKLRALGFQKQLRSGGSSHRWRSSGRYYSTESRSGHRPFSAKRIGNGYTPNGGGF